MWKDIIDFIEKISKEEDKYDLMSYYLQYVATINPFQSVNNCIPYKISKDLFKIKRITNETIDDNKKVEKLKSLRYKSQIIRSEVDKANSISDITQNIEVDYQRYIQIAFILKSIEKIHRRERLKTYNASLLTIITMIISFVSFKISLTIPEIIQFIQLYKAK